MFSWIFLVGGGVFRNLAGFHFDFLFVRLEFDACCFVFVVWYLIFWVVLGFELVQDRLSVNLAFPADFSCLGVGFPGI